MPDERIKPSDDKVRRKEARAVVETYHQQELRKLLEHVRAGFSRLDAGEIDEFELDDLIHRYKRAAKQLWIFCETKGGHGLYAAHSIEEMRARQALRDWWAESASGRPRT